MTDDLPLEVVIAVGCLCGAIVIVLIIALLVVCLQHHRTRVAKYQGENGANNANNRIPSVSWVRVTPPVPLDCCNSAPNNLMTNSMIECRPQQQAGCRLNNGTLALPLQQYHNSLVSTGCAVESTNACRRNGPYLDDGNSRQASQTVCCNKYNRRDCYCDGSSNTSQSHSVVATSSTHNVFFADDGSLQVTSVCGCSSSNNNYNYNSVTSSPTETEPLSLAEEQSLRKVIHELIV